MTSSMSNRDSKSKNFAFNLSLGHTGDNSMAADHEIDALTYSPPFESKLDIKMPTQPAEDIKDKIILETEVAQSTSFFIKAIEEEQKM